MPNFAGQAQHLEEQGPERRQMDLAEIADRAEVGPIVAHNGSKSQIAFAGGRDLPAGADAQGVGIDQEDHHHGHIERRLVAQLLGVIVVEGCEVHLRDEIQEEEHQVVFGQRFSRCDRLVAALLGVPGTIVLVSIVHDLAPAQCINALELGGTIIVAHSTKPVQVDRSRGWRERG